jgi:hypothetical protein
MTALRQEQRTGPLIDHRKFARSRRLRSGIGSKRQDSERALRFLTELPKVTC